MRFSTSWTNGGTEVLGDCRNCCTAMHDAGVRRLVPWSFTRCSGSHTTPSPCIIPLCSGGAGRPISFCISPTISPPAGPTRCSSAIRSMLPVTRTKPPARPGPLGRRRRQPALRADDRLGVQAQARRHLPARSGRHRVDRTAGARGTARRRRDRRDRSPTARTCVDDTRHEAAARLVAAR